MAQIITKPQVTATGQTTWKCSEPMVRPFLSVQLLILPVLASFYGGSRQVFHAMHGASSTSTMHACDWTRDARWAMEPTALDVMLVSAGHHQPARPTTPWSPQPAHGSGGWPGEAERQGTVGADMVGLMLCRPFSFGRTAC
jgi:hypothetical protein